MTKKITMKISLRVLVVCALFLGALSTRAARADENASANLFDALDARGVRQELRGKDLTSAWKIVKCEKSSRGFTNYTFSIVMDPESPGVPLFSCGEVFSAGSETYLIVYAPEVLLDAKPIPRRYYYDSQIYARLNLPEVKVAEDDALRLVLLNLRTAGSFTFTPFDPAKNLLTKSDQHKIQISATRAQSQSNLKQLYLSLMEYSEDHDQKLPPMRAAKSGDDLMRDASGKNASVFASLHPYFRNTQIFFNPATKRPYVPNWHISRKPLDAIKNPATTVAFYEDEPDSGGFRNVLFADGHTKSIYAAPWRELRDANKLSP